MGKKPKIICIGGPTGVGKTALAIEIARLFDGEIISCDSIAIYKHLDIGSAKPTKDEQNLAKHYLIDIKEPYENFSCGDYREFAKEKILDILSRGKLPIVVGGTGLYMKTLLFPMELGNAPKSAEIREKYKKLANEQGNEYVYNYLKQIDEESANKLHPKELAKVIRAIEIYELTGVKKSSFKMNYESEFDYMLILLNDERKTLYERINKRVDTMLNNGLESEVKNLIDNYKLSQSNQSMQGIGYKEFFDYFQNKITYDELVDNIKKNSRHYAKRQLTWFKAMPNVDEFKYKDKDLILNKIKTFLEDNK